MIVAAVQPGRRRSKKLKPRGSFAKGGFGHCLPSLLTGDVERRPVLFDEDKSLRKTPAGVGRFELEASIQAFETEPLKPEWSVTAWVNDAPESFIAPEFIFDRGLHHCRSGLDREFSWPAFHERRKCHFN